MVIETSNITKQYSGKGGCRNICLSVSERQIFGFLGRNGAGKSTFIKTMVGLLHADSGQAYILGHPAGSLEARKRIGFLPENFRYHEWLKGKDLLYSHGRLCDIHPNILKKRIPEIIDMVGLTGAENNKVSTYSKGMQQRIGIACALINNPDLVFLDEPTSALDPIGRRQIRELIVELRNRGKTIFLNSHLLSEIEMICDRIAIIKDGEMIREGALQDLLEGSRKYTLTLSPTTAGIRECIEEYASLLGEFRETCRLELKEKADVSDLIAEIVHRGGRIFEVRREQNTLEELFINLTERN